MVQRTPVCALPSMYSGGEFLRGAGRALAHYYAASKMRQGCFSFKEEPCPRDNSNIDCNMVYLSLPNDYGPHIRSNCRCTLPRNKKGHILGGCYTETPFYPGVSIIFKIRVFYKA